MDTHTHFVFSEESLEVSTEDGGIGEGSYAAFENRTGSLNISDYSIVGSQAEPTVSRSSSFGGPETRPPNVAVYYYVRIN